MFDPAAEWRQERIARNEASFRLINERLESSLRQLGPSPDPVPFVCECGSRSCQDSVLLTVAEYESVRAHASHFAVKPGHVFPDAEAVVARHDRYLVVEKRGAGALISELTNPR